MQGTPITDLSTYVKGPASVTDAHVALFDGPTGKIIKDGGTAPTGTNTGDQTITLTGDVTGSGAGSFAATIAAGAVTLAKMAALATARLIGRKTSGSGDPEALTGTDVTALLDTVVGDTGSGGTKGLVPAPSSGDAAAGKFLKASGAWAAPSGAVTIYPATVTVPLSTDFGTTIGTGLTVTDRSSRMRVVLGASSLAVRALLKASISTPYTIDLGMGLMTNATTSPDGCFAGIMMSDGTKYLSLEFGQVGDGSSILKFSLSIVLRKWTTASSLSSVVLAFVIPAPLSFYFLRITDDGTTRTYYYSSNGKDFYLLASETTNTFLTPTEHGLAFYRNVTTTAPPIITVYHFVVSNSVLGDAA